MASTIIIEISFDARGDNWKFTNQFMYLWPCEILCRFWLSQDFLLFV